VSEQPEFFRTKSPYPPAIIEGRREPSAITGRLHVVVLAPADYAALYPTLALTFVEPADGPARVLPTQEGGRR
jgi:hypothetical protein